MESRPVILVEFNELCPSLIDRWMSSGDLPNFKRFHDASSVWVTEADELNDPYLQPWIQWYSLHSGKPFKEHGVLRLSEGCNRELSSIWDILLEHGMNVMNFSSMNCRRFEAGGSVFLPDPWNDAERAFPAEMDVFRRFLVKSVQEQAHASWRMSEALELLTFLSSHGLRLQTVWAAVRQVAGEKLLRKPTRWQRVKIMDLIMLDVFEHYYQKHRPQFATFFSNSTAHLQHAYWRYLEPEKFSEPMTPAERQHYGDAILQGYVAMDRLLGRLMALAGNAGASLMFATALSQQPYLAFEGRGGRHYYRPLNVRALLQSLGIVPVDIQPIMAHQYILAFEDRERRLQAEESLSKIFVGERRLFDWVEGETPNRLVMGAQVYSILKEGQTFEIRTASGTRTESFFTHFYELEATKSGRHHPDGYFWAQVGRHRREERKVSILDVAPTILRHFGIDAERMSGTSLPLAA